MVFSPPCTLNRLFFIFVCSRRSPIQSEGASGGNVRVALALLAADKIPERVRSAAAGLGHHDAMPPANAPIFRYRAALNIA
jgi:hypothetical protein